MMQSSTRTRLAFLSTTTKPRQSRWSGGWAAPAMIAAGGGMAASNRALPLVGSRLSLAGRRRASRLPACSAAPTHPSTTPAQQIPHGDGVDDSNSRDLYQFEPSIWGDFFLKHTSPLACSTQQRRMAELADQLKKRVTQTVAASSDSSLHERMNLVDVLERLCLDHLFEDEISAALAEINDADVSGSDLQTVALVLSAT